jgi:hypothetical protein
MIRVNNQFFPPRPAICHMSLSPYVNEHGSRVGLVEPHHFSTAASVKNLRPNNSFKRMPLHSLSKSVGAWLRHRLTQPLGRY